LDGLHFCLIEALNQKGDRVRYPIKQGWKYLIR
jgi:hypothetical protein